MMLMLIQRIIFMLTIMLLRIMLLTMTKMLIQRSNFMLTMVLLTMMLMLIQRIIFMVFLLTIRVAEVAREHRWHPPKSLDSDENFKPEHTLFCRELRFVAIYALFFGDLWA